MKRLSMQTRRKISVSVFLFMALVVIVLLGNFKTAKKNEFKTANDPKKAEAISKNLKETVGKIYMLPNENPLVATVTEKEKLPEGNFYQQAIEGDKILVFEASNKIILYRPSVNKVVDVGTLEEAVQIPAQEDVAGLQATPTPAISQQPSTPSAQQSINVNFNPVTPTP